MGKRDKIRFEMTRGDALALDLLICRCGHRVNNHFTWDKSRSRCRPVARGWRVV